MINREVKELDPAVFHRLPPTFAVFTDTDNDIEAVVACIQALTMTLGAVSNESKSVIFEVLLKLCQRPIAALVNNFFGASKIKGFNSAYMLVEVNKLF